ncbi:MAG TPA: 3-phosphoshikimate 1-carboxyvinyltransferase [Candidatus Limnocylindrales bacterium]|nr:3-phosphoshikimate 1-carboxyvinyltransferase [Candidatus Limnocylindrales bacterium]
MATATWADSVEVPRAARLHGTPALPGDKSISHRALLLALLARGHSRITGASRGDDVRTTRALTERLGARVRERIDTLEIDAEGVDSLDDPGPSPIDCRNSGTTMRLTAGILAGQPFPAVLDGDESLRTRPMRRVVEPLRAMGADVSPTDAGTPPLRIRGRRPLRAIDWSPTVASAQVKSAILLAGLRADGTTRVHEPVPTRDHTERMLRARGVDVRVTGDGAGGSIVEIGGGQVVAPHDELVPGDGSAAAFWLVAGACHPDARIDLTRVGVNPGRRGALDILREMGATISERPHPIPDGGEPIADLRVMSSELRAVDVDARRAVDAIDEIPVLCLAATQARGVSVFRGLGELRVKESDRLAGIVEGLTAFGARVALDGDDVRVTGPTALAGVTVDGHGDHRLVMTFAIAGLLASGITTISGAASVAISDPGFLIELERIRA